MNRTCILTGAGSGLGRSLSVHLVKKGYRVFGIGRREDSLAETSQQCGTGFDAVVADISDSELLASKVNNIVSEVGNVDLLVNNAAVYPKVSFLDETIEEFEAAMRINVIAMANSCKLVLPHMIHNTKGMIINVGSWADRSPIEASAAYSASKGAVHALTKAIAKDAHVRCNDIQVHEWIPGHLKTQMSEFTGIDSDIAAKWIDHILDFQSKTPSSEIFVGATRWEAPKGIKERLKNKLLFWK